MITEGRKRKTIYTMRHRGEKCASRDIIYSKERKEEKKGNERKESEGRQVV